MTYNSQDKSNRLVRLYGTHNFHSGNGKFILSEETASGSSKQIKARLGLGQSRFHAIKKATFDLNDIPSQNYQLHKETGEVNPALTIFPTYQLNPGASIIDFNLDGAMAQDGNLDKFVVQAECLEIADYNSNGVQIDFGFSDDAGRVTADGILYLTGSLSIIDWAWWFEWTTWTRGLITITKDGQQIQVPRFPLNIGLEHPFDLDHFLDRVCQLTCSEWTWANGKIRMIAPIDRAAFMDINRKRIKKAFKFNAVNGENHFNGVQVNYRDFYSSLLLPAKPEIVKRHAANELPNYFVINAGVCRKDVAERIAHFWAKVKCDLTDFCYIRGTRQTYTVLPGDIVTVTHPTPDWTNERCRVIKKTEKEDRNTTSGIEKFPGYGIFLQREPVNPYKDYDYITPIVTRPAVTAISRFATPPAPTLDLQLQSNNLADGSVSTFVKGIVNLGNFGYPQTVNIEWKQPGGNFEFYRNYKPDGNDEVIFERDKLKYGIHYFRACAVSELGKQSLPVSEPIIIEEGAFYVNGRNIQNAADRTFTGLNVLGNYTGQDNAIVPQAAINARIDSATVVGDDLRVLLGIFFNPLTDGSGNPIHNQTASVLGAQVEVFNQFDELVNSFTAAAINRIGGQVICDFPRKYADALTGQCYFKIKVINGTMNYSLPIYLRGNSITTSKPAALLRVNCPLEGAGVPFSSSAIQTTCQFTSNVNLLKRKVGSSMFEYHATNFAPGLYLAQSLAELTDYEFQYESAANTLNRGNIFKARTKQQGEAAPARPSPTGINGGKNASNPQTQLDFSCISAADVETEVFVNGSYMTTIPAVAAGQIISYSISSLPTSTARSVKFRHKWGANDYSVFTEEITRTTDPAAPPAQHPLFDYYYYDDFNYQNYIKWIERGGSDNFTIQRSINYGSFTTLENNYNGTFNDFIETPFRTYSARYYTYRISRNGIEGYDEVTIEVPPMERDSPRGYGGTVPLQT